jgi:protein-export membrane protein SecD/preprotein translocase SecF subunit
MGKNLMPKIIVIIVLVVLGGLTLYPPDKKLKPGPDLGGGTSLIYQIDTTDMPESETRDLAQRMITVLRDRIDPANIQNLIWQPQGNTRFEIKMPLASAETRLKRQEFDDAKRELLDENIRPTQIMVSLAKPAEERAADFNDFTQEDPNRLAILKTLADAYDEREELRNQRDTLLSELETSEQEMSSAGIEPNEVKLNVADWTKLDVNELADSLREFADSNEHVEMLGEYVKKYSDWAEVVNKLTDEEFVERYESAKADLDKLNLTEDQLKSCYEEEEKSRERRSKIEKLITEFPDREDKIRAVVAAFDEYRPYQGRLDDPKDLQRMLKGAGILEFRILPTTDHPEVDIDEMNRQVELLKTKGPKFASNASRGKYVWCEIEDFKEWGIPTSIVGQFGEKYFVLASNQTNESLLHSTEGPRAWKLERSFPSTDEMGRRAIGFSLNDKGGILFGKLTGNNIDRPLCILLDGVAISAPSINERIGASGIIKGSFSQTDVFDMVDKLNAGSLPSKLIEQPISVKTIGPSIGADNRDKGIFAGFVGLCLVVFCMLVYYTLAGCIADAALFMNLLFVLAIMALIRATFTLPGIAGMILTIGMSVDANVLIFERIREEQQKGSSLRIAIRNGYQRAFRTILDANITTFITAAILFWVASEEIKGFALVLMLGIGSSMFTALFVTRVMFDFVYFFKPTWREMKMTILATWPFWLLVTLLGGLSLQPFSFTYFFILLLISIVAGFVIALVTTVIIFAIGYLAMWARKHGIIKEHLLMLNLIRKPNVNWMALRPIFISLSILLIAAGLFVFFTRDDATNNKYGIEFTSGTKAQINLKDNINLSRQEVENRIRKMGTDPNNPNPALATTSVYSIGKPKPDIQSEDGEKVYKQYEINTTETNKSTTTITLSGPSQHTVEAVTSAITKADDEFGSGLSNLQITQQSSNTFVVTTSQMNKSLVTNVLTTSFADANVFADVNIGEPQVDEVVNDAILKAFEGELEIQQDLVPTITGQEKITKELIDSHPELADFLGGIKITCEIARAATAEEILARLADLQYKPDMQNLDRYEHKILKTDLTQIEPNEPANSFVYISVAPEAGFRELTEDEWTRFVDNERTRVLAATRLETSLPRVTQIDPTVGAEAKQQALIAIVLSLFAIVTYIWVRFGDVRYGLAAIAALVHDVCITLGAITACTYIASTTIGGTLLIGDFKINLAIIAALLTIIGYSLNDTIVVFDRIRENRKKARLVPQTITNSINQTISRTILTSFTTFIVVLVMYIFGGQGLRGFTFAIGFGIIIGTYSSVAIAAPILLLGTKPVSDKDRKSIRAKEQKNRRKKERK